MTWSLSAFTFYFVHILFLYVLDVILSEKQTHRDFNRLHNGHSQEEVWHHHQAWYPDLSDTENGEWSLWYWVKTLPNLWFWYVPNYLMGPECLKAWQSCFFPHSKIFRVRPLSGGSVAGCINCGTNRTQQRPWPHGSFRNGGKLSLFSVISRTVQELLKLGPFPLLGRLESYLQAKQGLYVSDCLWRICDQSDITAHIYCS